MKAWKKIAVSAAALTLAASFPALAGQWHNDMNGWWYENDDGSYAKNGWYWLDGNQDGIAECYYFGTDGYMLREHGYVDGYEVDGNGAWIVNGKVQTKAVEVTAPAGEQTEAVQEETEQPAADMSDPMSVYRAAQDKMNAVDSMDASVVYKMSMSEADTAINMDMVMNLKLKGAQTGDIEFVSDGNMTMLGMEMPYSMFYTDGYYYIDMMGMKVKEAMPMAEALEDAQSNMELVNVDENLMENMQMRTEGGKTVISYEVGMEEINSYLNQVMGTAGMEDLLGSVDYRINITNGEAVIDESGYCTSERIYMDMDMIVTDPETGASESLNCKLDMSLVYNNPGQPVDFVIPSTEGYEDVTTPAL